MMLSVWVLVSVCCSDEELGASQPLGKSGDEVQFGLSLPGSSSRTIYGAEEDVLDAEGKVTGKAFPIYWVNGDKVQIYSPDCLEGRRNAEYQVSVSGTKQNYADALEKTSAAGVQWADIPADFYSVYPSSSKYKENGGKAENLKVNYMQEVTVTYEEKDGKDVPVLTPKMADCIMYAKAEDVAVGTTVNLSYKPITTAIMITLKVDASSAESFTIQSINLKAKQEVAGTFSINLADGSFADWMTVTENNVSKNDASSTIAVQIIEKTTGGFHTIQPGEEIEIPIFVAPKSDLSLEGWVVEVVTTTRTLKKTLSSGTPSVNLNLKAGQVHKMTMPTLNVAKEEQKVEWDPATWMVNIPRNVYLSEVSIPGSWNSLNSSFQGSNPSIASQYTKGVRAFHLDTRWTTTANMTGGIANNFYKESDLTAENMYLSVCDAGGGKRVRSGSTNLSTDLGQVMTKNNTSFETYLSQITSNVKGKQEYMILFCTFAHDSYNNPNKTGMNWMQAISNVCNGNDYVYDASEIDENTVIGDVLGHVIVIVNCENKVENESLPEKSKCFFCNIPNQLTSEYFPVSGFKSDVLHYSSSYASKISLAVSQAQITSVKKSNDEYVYIDGERGYYPSLTERNTVVDNIWNWSKTNYSTDGYAHDKWIYLGLGGATANSSDDTGDEGYDTIASNYSDKIINVITAMENKTTRFYPVGIVYQNFTTGSTNAAVLKILQLNNKYQLQYDPSKPSDYVNPKIAKTINEYNGVMQNGGNVIK